MADAGAEILADQRLLNALETLKHDTDADVREAAGWVKVSGKPIKDRFQELQKSVAEKDAEIARLRGQLAAYERGRFIRLMRALSDFWRRLT